MGAFDERPPTAASGAGDILRLVNRGTLVAAESALVFKKTSAGDAVPVVVVFVLVLVRLVVEELDPQRSVGILWHTTAWFLTPDERAKAVQRIKVRSITSYSSSRTLLTATLGKPNWSREQTLQTRPVSTIIAIRVIHPLTPPRFWEALQDPKTWLFALFSAIDNVPNSLTNQRQIIVSSFGFTNLQTTLLGCVDGTIEIATIFVGVTVAARLKDARGYVGAVWFLPNLLGVLLINFLPWENKVGLLFGQWLTGTSPSMAGLT